MNGITVILLNWNGLDFIQKFLPGIVAHTPKQLATIMVADNGSTDGSVDWIRSSFPEVHVLLLNSNYGYAGGYKKALLHVSTPYAVLLNSDVKVEAGWLEPLLEVMSDPSVGAAMPKILSLSQPDHFEYAGAAGGYIDRFAYPFCRGRIFSTVEKDEGQYNEVHDLFWASGACLMIRMQAYHDAGELDAAFFAHMEEIDLCWRMKLHQYRIVYQPASKIFHVGGGSLPNEHPHKIYLNFRNNLFLLWKNLPPSIRNKRIAHRKWLDALAAIQYLLKGRIGFIKAIWSAHRDFGKMRNGMTQTLLEYESSELPGWYNRSIVWDYFFKRKKRFTDLSL